jgi:hypothetical protein
MRGRLVFSPFLIALRCVLKPATEKDRWRLNASGCTTQSGTWDIFSRYNRELIDLHSASVLSPHLLLSLHSLLQSVMFAIGRSTALRASRTQLRLSTATTTPHISALARLLSSLAVLEQRDGKLNVSSLAAVTAAQKLGGTVTGLVAGSGVKAVAEEAAKVKGLEKIIFVENGAYDKVCIISVVKGCWSLLSASFAACLQSTLSTSFAMHDHTFLSILIIPRVYPKTMHPWWWRTSRTAASHTCLRVTQHSART